jgi:hypothetical protein
MVWKGKTHWKGKTVDVNLDDFFMVFAYGVMPFLLLLENCEDKFLPVFSTADKLRDFMEKNGKTVGCEDYTIKQITDADDFCDSIWEQGVRVMLDPRFIDKHHTKWFEVVKDKNGLWKYIDAERN